MRAVQAALASLVGWAAAERAQVSARILELSTNREVAATSADRALNPASNQKILTIAAALHQLGPEHRFTSVLAGRQGPEGLSELVLRSDGDPELSREHLAEWVEELLARGHRQVNGDLLVDQSAFDPRWDPPGYEQRPNDWAAYRAPVSAVAIDRNTVTLHLSPEAIGKPALAWFEPRGLTTIEGEVKTVGSMEPQSVRLTVRPWGDRLVARIGGTVRIGHRVLRFSRRIAAPELAPGYVLRAQLARREIRVSGQVRAGGTQIRQELVHRSSRPLAQIVHALGKNSDNFSAEMLLKALGARAVRGQGTSADGLAVIESYLDRLGARKADTRIGNGSGLYDKNRLSAATLVRVLAAAHRDPRVGPELLASLAIGGVDGTLAERFKNLAPERRIRAKTGTLADVTALAGYVLAPPPKSPLAFALLLNGISGKHNEARRRIDAVIQAAARL